MVQPPPLNRAATSHEELYSSGRGCAVTVLVSAVLILVLLGCSGVGLLVWLRGPGGDYAKAPPCALVEESGVLERLVKGYVAVLDAPVDTQGATWWDGTQCRWTTTEDSPGMPASVSVAFIRSGNRFGYGGEASARADLKRESEGNEVTTVADLGDEAVQWYDATTLHGCVAVRKSNLMISACYEASTDFSASREISAEEAMQGAVSVAREIVALLEQEG